MKLEEMIAEVVREKPTPTVTFLLRLAQLAQTMREVREAGEESGLDPERVEELIRIASHDHRRME